MSELPARLRGQVKSDMKIYCGTDIVEIKRMAKYVNPREDGSMPSFITKCFCDSEIEYINSRRLESKRTETIAGLYAAKEAISKALGTGVMTNGIGFHDFLISHSETGAPVVSLCGCAGEYAKEIGITSIALSISHDGDYAVAYCTMLGSGEEA